MNSEALEYLVRLGPLNRPQVIDVGDGSGRRFLYNDMKKEYEPLERYNVRAARKVSNIESFTAMVLGEIGRSRKAGTTEPTVIFTTDGGDFWPDDRDSRVAFLYRRTLSPAYQALSGVLGKPMEHIAFVRLLQGIRTAIVDDPGTPFGTLLQRFRKVSFDSNTRVDSQPLLDDDAGTAGTSFQINFTARGGPMQVALPSRIPLLLPLARGGEAFPTEVEVELSLVEVNQKNVLRFALAWPLQHLFAEEAIEAEVAYFKGKTKDIPDLLVLENY